MSNPIFTLTTIPDNPGRWWPEPTRSEEVDLGKIEALCHDADRHTYQLKETRVNQDVSVWYVYAGNTSIAMVSDGMQARDPQGHVVRRAIRELLTIMSPRNTLALVRRIRELEREVQALKDGGETR